jgi:hypothetical protein
MSNDAESEEAKSEAPLYDDFLDFMNNAVEKALTEQRAIPAYDDFLHFVNHHAENAQVQATGKASYDEFLHFVKNKADETQQQQLDDKPSYDDFLNALKASTTVALMHKEPVPTYEQFLFSLKDAAEKSMANRLHSQEHSEVAEVAEVLKSDESQNSQTTETSKSEDTSEPSQVKEVLSSEEAETAELLKDDESENPFDRVKRGFKKARDQITGKKEKDREGRSKLQRELRDLKAKERHYEKNEGSVPHHERKPIMKRINVLRTQLCWKRPNLWKHEKCLRFLGVHCIQESTGEGICREFAKKAKQKCETSDDPRWKEDYCALGEALEESYGEDEEEEEEYAEEQKQKGVGTDKDLDNALDQMDKDLADHEEEKGGDRDGDGVTDDEDAFPDDPNEWKDTDKDGIGDNADQDRDGDGHANEVDAFPDDPKEWKDTDGDGIGDNADKDSDNDGVNDDKDAFPNDSTEWLDSDKDKVGDNADAYPYNPNCHDPNLPCLDQKGAKEPKPNSVQDPATLDKDQNRLLPAQGYNEHMEGAPVRHANYYTYVSDWQNEFPDMPHPEKITMAKICKEHPDNAWCKRHATGNTHFR